VIYSFFELLRAYLAFVKKDSSIQEDKIYEALGEKGDHRHSFPFNYVLPPMHLHSKADGEKLFKEIKYGIL